jgi:deoxycytidylate deaminase
MDILEFGRMIHAEMSAISDAARLGRSTLCGILFSTAFPCHICAKHIVASGIKRVVFLEPYPKSYAEELHSDSITFHRSDADKRVIFEPFIGISPRRYQDIFEKKNKRKDADGKALRWYEFSPKPRVEDKTPGYAENEESSIAASFRPLG